VPWKLILKLAKKLPEWLPMALVLLLVQDLCLWYQAHLLALPRLDQVQYK
jgi:hypothetical protein